MTDLEVGQRIRADYETSQDEWTAVDRSIGQLMKHKEKVSNEKVALGMKLDKLNRRVNGLIRMAELYPVLTPHDVEVGTKIEVDLATARAAVREIELQISELKKVLIELNTDQVNLQTRLNDLEAKQDRLIEASHLYPVPGEIPLDNDK